MKARHHGYLLTGSIDRALEHALDSLSDILGVEKKSLHAHPDFSLFNVDKLTIDDARQIRTNSSKKSFSGKGRVFLIQTNFFTREACNALLKTFEEPSGLNYFFLITSSPENILETLRSRLVVINFNKEQTLSSDKREKINNFMKAKIDDRMKMTQGIIKNKEKTKERTLELLNDLEIILRENLLKSFSKETVELLGEINKYRGFLFQKGSSPRMILEHLALVI